MSGFKLALRQEGDTENPTLGEAFGEHITAGLLAMWELQGSRKAGVLLLAKNECHRAKAVYYKGRLLPEIDEQGRRLWKFHPGTRSTGFDDPLQGRPFFFPTLNHTFSTYCYLEFSLPEDLSTGDEAPSGFRIQFEGRVIDDYAQDAQGNLIVQGRSFSANNMRVGLAILREKLKLPLSRFHAASWLGFRAACDAGIGWTDSGGDGLLGNYYNDKFFAGLVRQRIDERIDFDFSPRPRNAPEVTSNAWSCVWTGQFKARESGLHTFYVRYDDSARLVVNGQQLINDQAGGGARERSGSINLVAGTKYDIRLEYRQDGGPGVIRFDYSSPTQGRVLIPKFLLYSSSSNAPRTIPRYTAHVVFREQTDALAAFESVMARAPGCRWQDVGIQGKLKIKILLPTNPADQTPIHQFFYDPNQTVKRSNIVFNTFTIFPAPDEQRPDFLRLSFRDLDSEFLEEGFTEIDRANLRQARDGFSVDPGIIPLGVMHRSLADRIGELQMRLQSDLPIKVALRGMPNAHHVSKGSFVEVIHDLPGWVLPRLFMVIEDAFVRAGADEKDFLLQSISSNFYSDTDHGALLANFGSDIPYVTDAPPLIQGLTRTEVTRVLRDGNIAAAIQGTAQFGDFGGRQRGRIHHHRPNDAPGYFRPLDDMTFEVDPASRQGSFEIYPVEAGTHIIKVVSESERFGRHLPVADAQEFSIPILALPPPPLAPTNLAGLSGALSLSRDAAGNIISRWLRGKRVPDIILRGEESEAYMIRFFYNGQLKREVRIQIRLSEPLIWTRDVSQGDVGGCPAYSTIDNAEGSIFSTGNANNACYFRSQRLPTDDCLIEFEIDDRMPPVVFSLVADPPGAATGIYYELRNDLGFPLYMPEYQIGLLVYLAPKSRRPLAGDRFSFRLANGICQYHFNYRGEQSAPMWTSGRKNLPPFVQAVAALGFFNGEPQAALRARAIYLQNTSFIYSTDMQGGDGIPQGAAVQVEVRQISSLVGEGALASGII